MDNKLKNLNRPEISGLTGLRFFAAFYVFLFHLQLRWPITYEPFLKNIIGQGAIGMSIFFVLSGFVLAYSYTDRVFTFKIYFINRFARIYPIYFLAALITLPWIGISFNDLGQNNFKAVQQSLILIIANIFLIQAWFPQFFSLWNDSGSWSISVEAFCYLILPLLLPNLVKLRRKGIILIFIVFWFLAVIPGLTVDLFGTNDFPIFYAMPIFRLPEFLIGVCIFLIMRRGFYIKIRSFVLAYFIVLFFMYLGFFAESMPIYVGHNWIFIPVISLLIMSLANSDGIFSKLLSMRIFVWLGTISYCFYSFQVFLLLFIIDHHSTIITAYPFLTDNKLLGLTAFTILLFVSALAHHFIEAPVRNLIRESKWCANHS